MVDVGYSGGFDSLVEATLAAGAQVKSFGPMYQGKQTGTFGDFGCFSFNGNKIITTGGGGVLVGRNKSRVDHIGLLSNLAKGKSETDEYPEVGFNYRMSNLQAALGLAQLQRLKSFLTKKTLFNKIYREELGQIKGLRFQKSYAGAQSSFWLTAVTFDPVLDLPRLMKEFRNKGIETKNVFTPLTEFPPYRRYKK